MSQSAFTFAFHDDGVNMVDTQPWTANYTGFDHLSESSGSYELKDLTTTYFVFLTHEMQETRIRCFTRERYF